MRNFTNLSPKEKSRTYNFNGTFVKLENVISISVSDSGTHYLETEDGKKHILPTGWVHIEIDTESWTF